MSRFEQIKYNFGYLSQYRSALMGISIIMILLCHARMDGANLPDVMLSILSLGNWGVDIFLLVSGIGMSFSIQKRGDNINWGSWIFGRLNRILVPYLILETPLWIWYSLKNGIGISGFLYHISFCSYWMEHVGLWFLALLIPLYIITPVLYKLLSSKRRYLYLFILLVLVMVLSVSHIDGGPVINNIQDCLSRVPCYLIGLCIGNDVRESRKSCLIYIIPIILYIILQSFDYFRVVYKGWIWAILCSVIFTQLMYLLSQSRSSKMINMLNFIGLYTLELYIGLDISKIILIYFMDLSTSYWILAIVGGIGCGVLYNIFQKLIKYTKTI